jgi:hypothetical protein
MTVFIGRKELIGVGIEATPGTGVAPQAWQRLLALTLDPNTTVIENTRAMGRIETNNDSAVTEQWVEGSINAKITDFVFGYFLLNFFGTVNAALHSGETTIYDNTFTLNQSNITPSLTLSRVNSVNPRRFPMVTQSDLEIDVKQNDWAQFTSTVMGLQGATASDTTALVTEHEFTSKHVNIKVASTQAGLTSATALQLKSLKMKLSKKVDRFTPLGTVTPVSFDNESVSVSGTIVLRYTDHTLEDLGYANTAQFMSIDMKNTDTTVGTATNPELYFQLDQARLAPITLDNNLDQVLSQTINFTGELNMSTGSMIKAVLTNAQNGYAHA